MFQRVDEWDCIVVGGGIVGCSAAYYLSKAGMRCLIVEADGIAAAQSGRNLGFVRQQGRDFRELELAIEANRIWRQLEAELGRSVGWMQGGNVALAPDAKAAESFEGWTRRATAEFSLDTRMLSAAELKALVPELHGDYAGAMYTASDGKADPVSATRAFFEGARAAGADASIGRPVDAIVTGGGAVTGVRVGNTLLKARTIICAAGAGTAALLRKLAVLFPQDCIRATVLRTERTASRIDTGVWGVGIGVRQSRDGSIHMSNAGGEYDVRLSSLRYAKWFLPPLRNTAGSIHMNFLNLFGRAGEASTVQVTDMPPSRDDPRPSRRFAALAIREFREMFPSLATLKVLSAWAGNIENTPDLIPAVGPTRAVRGLLVASGFSGHGFCSGPAAGKALAAIATGAPAPASLAALSPDRFADGTWSAAGGFL